MQKLYPCAGACACVSVCRISLCVCVFVTASVREHGEMLFTAFRWLDCMTAANIRGRRGWVGVWRCALKRWG